MVRNPLSSVIVLVAVISARMIMAPLPSATAAGRGAAQHPRLEWVSASDVDQTQLAMLPSPVELDSYSNTHVVPQVDAATVPDPDLKQQCQSHAEADTPKGWIKSRFEVCIHRPKDLVLRPIGGGDPIGRLQFDEWVLGFAVDGTREIDYVASVENIIVQNLGSSGWLLRQ